MKKDGKNIKSVVLFEWSKNCKSGSLHRSYSYICSNAAQIISIKIYRNIKWQK